MAAPRQLMRLGKVVALLVALWASPLLLVDASDTGLVYDPAEVGSEEGVAALFERWRAKHGKVYRGEVEKHRRYVAFKENVKYVEKKRKGSLGSKQMGRHHMRVGLNRFADLSNQEFKTIYSRKMVQGRRPMKRRSLSTEGSEPEWRKREAIMGSCSAPATLDWRKKGIVTAVKDQGDCGGCWSFSATGGMEGINALVTGELISLSEQELIDCDTTNYGCEGGYMDYAFEWVIQNGGIDTETDYPYTSVFGTDGTCNTTKESKKVVSIDGYEDVAETEDAVFCAVVGQPVSVGIDGSSFDFQLYTGGIYDGDCSGDPDDIDHAVLIVGYGSEDDEDYWIVKNSWGSSWGENGYALMRRNTGLKYGLCAINAMASYPTKTGSASPSPDYSPPSETPPPPPPSPPSPSPVECGDGSYCDSGDTCCCTFEIGTVCALYGCCEYTDAVCCTDSLYCCPNDYPICDTADGLCLQSLGDSLGVKMKKRRVAKHRFPWTKFESLKHGPRQPVELAWRGQGLDATVQ